MKGTTPSRLYTLAVIGTCGLGLLIQCSDSDPTADSSPRDAAEAGPPLDLGVDKTVPDAGVDADADLKDTGIDMPDAFVPGTCAVSAGGAMPDYSNSIAVDGAGNMYITGGIQAKATFGATTLTPAGSRDVFVAKLDSSCKFKWAVSAGGADLDDGWSIALDGSGNIYVSGRIGGQASFGSSSVSGSGFLAKLDKSGSFKWAIPVPSLLGNSIAVDTSGNIYLAGRFKEAATFGGKTLTSKGASDIFVAKYDSAGKSGWAERAGGISDDYVNAIAVDASGHSYVTGRYTGVADFGSTTLSSTGTYDIFVAGLNGSGVFKWATTAGGAWQGDEGRDIAVDSSDSSYVAGGFQGTAYFKGKTTTTHTVTSKGYIDAFVAKIDNSDGAVQWVTPAGGPGKEEARGVAVDGSGNSYIAGDLLGVPAVFGKTTLPATKGNVFVAKLDKLGAFVWANNAGSGSFASCHDIAVDAAGRSHLTGLFGNLLLGGKATFGSATLTAKGAGDVFVATVDATGNF